MSIATNYANLHTRITKAAIEASRDPETITLIAVSKFQSQTAVLETYAAGQRVFGENYVQEAESKFAPLRASHPAIQLQCIGALQTNKAAQAVRLFDVIATLDRPKLAHALAAEMAKQQRWPDIFIEIKCGHEPQKAGIPPTDLPAFITLCRQLHLPIKGLMCVPPAEYDPTSYFNQLTRLADDHQLTIRSMGMSNDFTTAIHCGSTQVRIGTALFGARQHEKSKT
jgi:pyridoxal phosphate enzyme (YggS family)